MRPSAKTDSVLRKQELLQQGRLDQAKEKIDQQIRLHSFERRGLQPPRDRVHRGKGLSPGARRIPARVNRPRLHPGPQQPGESGYRAGKPGLAEKQFRESPELDPANRDGNYNLGLLLMAKGAPAPGHWRFQRVHPQSRNAIQSGARLSCGRTNAEALKMATELSAAQKQDVQLHFTLGVLLAAEKQYQPRSSNWNRPTRYSRKHSKFFTTWDRLIFAGHDRQSRARVESRAEFEAGFGRGSLSAGAGRFRARRNRWMLSICWCAPTSLRRRIPTSFF